MAGDRWVWVPVGALLESLSAAGAGVWGAPAEVRRTIGELLGVMPVTHVEIEIERILGAGGVAPDWRRLLEGEASLKALLAELSLAITDALGGRAAWGLGLPRLSDLAAALGDASERGLVKAGVRLASTLQFVRESALRFVTLTVGDPSPAVMKPLAPVLRNAGLYGWERAVRVDGPARADASLAEVEVVLADGADASAVAPLWHSGRGVGGGLTAAVWRGEAPLEGKAPESYVLYGAPPAGLSAAAIVAAGQRVRAWLGK